MPGMKKAHSFHAPFLFIILFFLTNYYSKIENCVMIKDMKTVETILESSKTNHLAPFFPHPEEVLFFDIETTGFSPKNAVVYLIGCAFFTKSGWKISRKSLLNP